MVETTESSVTGEAGVSTEMVGPADFSVTGKFPVAGEPAVSTGKVGPADFSESCKFCNRWTYCQHWKGGTSRFLCNRQIPCNR